MGSPNISQGMWQCICAEAQEMKLLWHTNIKNLRVYFNSALKFLHIEYLNVLLVQNTAAGPFSHLYSLAHCYFELILKSYCLSMELHDLVPTSNQYSLHQQSFKCLEHERGARNDKSTENHIQRCSSVELFSLFL